MNGPATLVHGSTLLLVHGFQFDRPSTAFVRLLLVGSGLLLTVLDTHATLNHPNRYDQQVLPKRIPGFGGFCW
ncbi:MAG: hypothetical protein ACFCD0_23740 [Gemmataceae bacterium]